MTVRHGVATSQSLLAMTSRSGAWDHVCVDKNDVPRIIKEIGRGRHAGDISRDDAEAVFAAILRGQLDDLETGAILIALRVKGESLEELAGFMSACEASYEHLAAEPETIPVVVPSYNGARALPNLTALFALLLAREGVPVLIHGVTRDPRRVTTCEVLRELGYAHANTRKEARSQLASRCIAFVPIETMAPSIARVLSLRERLGVRNSAHTLVKMIQPFAGPALRIVSVTHPEYLTRMREYFSRYDSGALLMRGAEGEAVAHPRREAAIEWAFGGRTETWYADGERPSTNDQRTEADLPFKDAESTARWIEAALNGNAKIPAPILHQVECCKRALAAMRP